MSRLTPAAALARLAETSQPFVSLMRERGVEVEIHRPVGEDLQTPHDRDELYVVIAGHGVFVNGGEHHPFEPGEVLFVQKGVEHRFDSFSDDFATWVIFFD